MKTKVVLIKTWDEMVESSTIARTSYIDFPEGPSFVSSMERAMPKNRVITVIVEDGDMTWDGWEISDYMIRGQHVFEVENK